MPSESFSQPASTPGNTPHKIALVTGGAKRIGREIAVSLARAGYNVAITYRESEALALVTAREIEAAADPSRPVRSLAIPMEVRSEDSIREAVAKVASVFGGIDLLSTMPASLKRPSLKKSPLHNGTASLRSIPAGRFSSPREALPYLKAAHGRIVNMGSLGGIEPWAAQAHYCSSKAALHMLTQTMAKAWAPEISVNCVAPGYIEMHRDGPERPIAPIFAAKTPMGRNGTAEETAAAVLFFRHRPPLHHRANPLRRRRAGALGQPCGEIVPRRAFLDRRHFGAFRQPGSLSNY